MCLIITGKSAKIRNTLLNTAGLLDTIYTSNPDGIGLMYSTAKGLKTVKVLPKSAADARAIINKIPKDAREMAIHFRWATHGKTDLHNCHPYDVIPGYVAMMHNGVLHTGNEADKDKSDTWHFIKDYLSESVHMAPELVFVEGFLAMIAEFIGDNRFVFMNGEGRISHVNKDSGIEHDGMWFSNTYAWNPALLIPTYRSRHTSSRYLGSWNNTEADEEDFGYYSRSFNTHKPTPVAASKPFVTVDEITEHLEACDAPGVCYLLEAFPSTTVHLLCKSFIPSPTSDAYRDEISAHETAVYDMLLEQDMTGLLTYLAHSTSSAATVADVICYYLNWERCVSTQPSVTAV